MCPKLECDFANYFRDIAFNISYLTVAVVKLYSYLSALYHYTGLHSYTET
jgi:hypothetical protein